MVLLLLGNRTKPRRRRRRQRKSRRPRLKRSQNQSQQQLTQLLLLQLQHTSSSHLERSRRRRRRMGIRVVMLLQAATRRHSMGTLLDMLAAAILCKATLHIMVMEAATATTGTEHRRSTWAWAA
jgi:hypothetical protein